MTKQDYELIAGSVARTRMVSEMEKNSIKKQAKQAALHLVAIDLAASLAAVNTSFDKFKFYKACGISEV